MARERLFGLTPSKRAKYFIFLPERIIGCFISGARLAHEIS
jgi:hypothetical protein